MRRVPPCGVYICGGGTIFSNTFRIFVVELSSGQRIAPEGSLFDMPEESYISLSELQRRIKGAVEASLPVPLWVAAEIAELKVNYSGHCYLELVEKAEPAAARRGDAGAVPKAQARAVIWRSQYAMLSSYFETETGCRLEAGMKVLAKVLVSYHELYGLALQVVDLNASYTLGEVERQRQQTIRRLQADGVWDMNRETPLPLLVQRIAVVSSSAAAVRPMR